MLKKVVIVCMLLLLPLQSSATMREVVEQFLALGRKYYQALPRTSEQSAKGMMALMDCQTCKRTAYREMQVYLGVTDTLQPMETSIWREVKEDVLASEVESWKDIVPSFFRQAIQKEDGKKNNPRIIAGLAEEYIEDPNSLVTLPMGEKIHLYAAIATVDNRVADALFSFCYAARGMEPTQNEIIEGIRLITQPHWDVRMQQGMNSHILYEVLWYKPDTLSRLRELGFAAEVERLAPLRQSATRWMQEDPDRIVTLLGMEKIAGYVNVPDISEAALDVIANQVSKDPSLLETNWPLIQLLEQNSHAREMLIQRTGLADEAQHARETLTSRR